MKYKKELCRLESAGKYAVMVPVWYEFENRPSWRTVCTGTKEFCLSVFGTFPDSLQATESENKKNIFYKKKQAEFYDSIGQKKRAANIRKIYKLEV